MRRASQPTESNQIMLPSHMSGPRFGLLNNGEHHYSSSEEHNRYTTDNSYLTFAGIDTVWSIWYVLVQSHDSVV